MVASPGSFLFAGPLASANGESGRSGRAGTPATSTMRAASSDPDAGAVALLKGACAAGGSGRGGEGAENKKTIATAAAPAAAATIRRRDDFFPTRLSAAFRAMP